MAAQRYVSNELTHFVGAKLRPEKDKQFELFIEIIRSGTLGQRTRPRGTPVSLNIVHSIPFVPRDGELIGVHCVCFCDIPIADFSIHVRKYGEFGIAFHKPFLTKQAATPVFYVAQDSRYRHQDLCLGDHYLQMLNRMFALLDNQKPREHQPRAFLVQRILGYFKPFDSSLAEDDPNNYYMEREWRVLGNVEFDIPDIARIIIPREFARQFRERVPEYYGQISFPDE